MTTIITVVLALALCALVGAALYRRGLQDGLALTEQARPLPRLLPKMGPKKPAEEAPELVRLNTIIQNIDVYDGTKKGQSKIENL